jgi:hypothetical protein
MASAMIDRAEFLVQRKSTFKGSWLLTIFITPSPNSTPPMPPQ